MRRWLLVVSLFLLASTVRAGVLHGTWHITQNGWNDHTQLELTREHSNFGHSIDVADLRGLTSAQMNASTETAAHFQIVREAGVFDMNGSFLNGDGVGRFTFTPDSGYSSRLQSLGVESSELTDERLYSLAALDVSSGFIREMQSLGYRESLERYIAFRIHGATPDFVRALQSLGYTNVSADRLVAFRIHGVTPDYIRDMKDLGVRDLSSDRLVAMRIHGVSSDYVRQLRDLGYRDLDSDDLVAMRIHGVSIDFIQELANAGYKNVPVEKLVAMRIHGVDAEFIRKVK